MNMLHLDLDIQRIEHGYAQSDAKAMDGERRQLPPVDVHGGQQEPRYDRLGSERHHVVGAVPAQTNEIHVRDSTEVDSARDNERTELAKAIATHLTRA
jgi:hypothetical protein